MPYNSREKRKEWSRRYYAREKERVLGIKKRWAERNPEKRKAQITVGNAIRDGKLLRQPCEECGATKVHAHHDDYAQPLVVRWLCPIHHRKAHQEGSV